MCGIAGQYSLASQGIANLKDHLIVMSELIKHRGPDGKGLWTHPANTVGLAHRRLTVIDHTSSAQQPMMDFQGNIITYNGEIYNYRELRDRTKNSWNFHSRSDTECILAVYQKYGIDAVKYLRGMFAFALWDDQHQRLICARDRAGIKPFYYTIVNNIFYFASEIKALIPFVDEIATDENAFAEYLTFQYCLSDQTLFKNIYELKPGHTLVLDKDKVDIVKYWDIDYTIDFSKDEHYCAETLIDLLEESIELHTRSDTTLGSYVSGGIDSSLVYSMAQDKDMVSGLGFHGRFFGYDGYDESAFAEAVVDNVGGKLLVRDISSNDFVENFTKIIYHLDVPTAGPGSFPQYMVSQTASEHVKVVLGGQGGDELFGGYARYQVAYLEQALKAAIEGDRSNKNYVVTLGSMIPSLSKLKEYKPLIKNFWSSGLFDSTEKRYFSLINRSSDMQNEIEWGNLDMMRVFDEFMRLFNGNSSIKFEAYLDKMTHFDFKASLPALLHVEDRMSMAHGIESRVPLLDHPLIEFAATVPANIKFKNGNMKHLLKSCSGRSIPHIVTERRDKMGFPVPLAEWARGDLEEFVIDNMLSMAQRNRPYVNSRYIIENLNHNAAFSRKLWALLSLEVWYQEFHDKFVSWKKLIK